MKTKTKKLTCLTLGLTGALATSAVIGAALSACTITTSGSTSGDNITLPDTWYSKDINWDDATSRNNLIMDKQGIVYSNKYMTEIIAIAPGYGGSTITIPASVRSISGYNNVTTSGSTTTKTATGAFEGLTSLTNVVFAGKNITQIGGAAFKNCTNLQTVNLPSSVNLIGTSAFENCYSLSSINLDNVQYIGTSAFSGAFTNIPFGSLDINLTKVSYIGASAFSNATGVKYFDFSKNITLTSIGDYAFNGCTYLTGVINLTNDNYLSSIGASAFSGCTGITNIYISNVTPLKTIGASAFSGCTSLVSIGTNSVTSGFIIPSTVTSIGATAFANTLINSIDMSQTTATNPLAAGTFKDMPELTSINLGSYVTTLPAILFQNTPKLSEFDLVVPASVTSIATANGNNVGGSNFSQTSYSTFHESGFKSIDLSKTSITSTNIGYCYFQGCSNLETVKLKSTITQIRFRAFYNCSSLKNVIFVNTTDSSVSSESGFVALSTLSELGSYAFYGSGIESVDLSAVTTNIMGTADYTSASSNSNNYRFANCPNLTSVKLPTSTTIIPSFNFTNNPKLETFNFSDLTNLTTIYGNNFNGTNFTTIDLSSNSNLAYNTFSNNSNLFQNLLQNAIVKLPSSITEIKSNNFTYAKQNENGSGTTTTNLNFEYPNGFGNSSTTHYSSKILLANNTTNFSFLSRVSGELDFSNLTNLQGVGQKTMFGSTTLTSLKFSAKTFASGLFNDTQLSSGKYTYLGFIGTGISAANTDTSQNPSTYGTEYLPFGNMTSLNAITFNNFTSSDVTNDSTSSSVMAKTTDDTWHEVTRIINSFSTVTSNTDDSGNKVANLSSWGEVANDVTAVISYANGNIVSSVELRKTDGDREVLATISDSLGASTTFKYEGVTWTINVDNSAGTITLTSSSDINAYRVVIPTTSGSTTTYPAPGYKVFFNTQSTTNEDSTTTVTPNSSITVTLNIVPASSSSE